MPQQLKEVVDKLLALKLIDARPDAADVVDERLRFYIRKCEGGYLVVLMSAIASPSMVRLNCDIVLPALKGADQAKGLRRLCKP